MTVALGCRRHCCFRCPLLTLFVLVSARTLAFIAPGPLASRTTKRPSITIRAMGGSKDTARVAIASGMGEVAHLYSCFLIDQWGVMHNGSEAYPGAVECIEKIAALGKPIVLLSNSSKRKEKAFTNLTKMGFNIEHIVDIVTSGDLGWHGLHNRDAEPFASLGTKVLCIGNGDDDKEYCESAGCELADAEHADFLLARGVFALTGSSQSTPTLPNAVDHPAVQAALKTALERSLPMLVTNPDVIRPGTNDAMPGVLGRVYAESGGVVHYVGKPHGAVYQECMALLKTHRGEGEGEYDSAEICGVGDSLSHDILGAHLSGMKSIFTTGGVHYEELGIAPGADARPDDDKLNQLLEKHLPQREARPTHVVTSLKW